MSLPADDISAFVARRRRVLDWMQAQGGGVAILATAPQALRNRDADYPYRHDSDFYYLTGFIEPEVWLILIAGADTRAILFCRARNEAHEIWEGVRIGPQAAAARFGMDDAHPRGQPGRTDAAMVAGSAQPLAVADSKRCRR
ncbi:aminopeptidase P, N-terminal domain protein [Bordetella holmesii 44057]|nr:aminopeptidase P, N-terminal domain protein [Bordetella holmesii 44057]